MKNIIFCLKKRMILSFILLSVSIVSCDLYSEREDQIGFYKSQERNSSIIGVWSQKAIYHSEEKEDIHIFCEDGQYIQTSAMGVFSQIYIEYYYTKDETFYLMNQGSGNKIAPLYTERLYEIECDTLIFFSSLGGDSSNMILTRMTDAKQTAQLMSSVGL